MTAAQMQQYDIFLDENDWDIYYWATQEPTPTSTEYAEGGGPDQATPTAQGKPAAAEATGESKPVKPSTGEWAQTWGTFKPQYRPVPQRWKNSEILSMLRKHVIDRSAGSVMEDKMDGEVEGQTISKSRQGGSGLGMMPELRNFDQ